MNDSTGASDLKRNTRVHGSSCPACRGRDSIADRTIAGFQVVRCPSCGCGYVHPRPDETSLQMNYENRALNKDRYSGRGGLKTAFFEQCLGVLGSYSSRGKLLDFGCGDCGFLNTPMAGRYELFGSDLNPFIKDLPHRNEIRFFTGALNASGIPDGFFDVVFTSATYEHLIDPAAVTHEIHRILKPGGIVMSVSVPNYQALPVVLGIEDWYDNCPPEHVNFFTKGSFTTHFKQHGFLIEKSWTYGLDFDLLLRNVSRKYRNFQKGDNNPAMSRLKTEKSFFGSEIFDWRRLSNGVGFLYFRIGLGSLGDKIAMVARKQ